MMLVVAVMAVATTAAEGTYKMGVPFVGARR